MIVVGKRSTPGFIHGLPKTQQAVTFARRAHDGQRRRVDGAPFLLHPLEVASLLYYAGAADHLIAAGVLHDAIEKAHVLATDLREGFGSRVAGLVLAVSEDQRIEEYAPRKAALRAQVAGAGEEALMLFAADKLSKVRELHLEPTPPRQVTLGRRRDCSLAWASIDALPTLPRITRGPTARLSTRRAAADRARRSAGRRHQCAGAR